MPRTSKANARPSFCAGRRVAAHVTSRDPRRWVLHNGSGQSPIHLAPRCQENAGCGLSPTVRRLLDAPSTPPGDRDDHDYQSGGSAEAKAGQQ